jgi:MFS family permease
LLLLALPASLWWLACTRRLPEPFVATVTENGRRFLAVSLAAQVRMLVAISWLIALPLFFEDVQSLAPAQVGLLMAIYLLFLFLASWPGGCWSDRVGARLPGMVGFAAMFACVLLLLGLATHTSLLLIVVALAVRGIGAGISQVCYSRAAVTVVDAGRCRAVVGLYGTLRYSGLALGTVLIGIFLDGWLEHHSSLAAVAAYHELWLLLAALLALGMLFTWLMGAPAPAIATTTAGTEMASTEAV